MGVPGHEFGDRIEELLVALLAECNRLTADRGKRRGIDQLMPDKPREAITDQNDFIVGPRRNPKNSVQFREHPLVRLVRPAPIEVSVDYFRHQVGLGALLRLGHGDDAPSQGSRERKLVADLVFHGDTHLFRHFVSPE